MDIESGAALDIEPYTAGISRLVVDENGNWALFTSMDGSVWLWDLTGEEANRQLELDDPSPAMGVVFVPGGQSALVSFASGTIIHVDLESGGENGRLIGHQDLVRALAVSPV